MNELIAENQDLRVRLAEAEETLQAIRAGEVDALVVSGVNGEQVFTLQGADYPYRVLVEEMSEGALTLTVEGVIFYANRRLADMLKTPLEQVIGARFEHWIAPADQAIFWALLHSDDPRSHYRELSLVAGDGTTVPCYLSFTVLQVAEIQGCFCLVATDLTEQKRSEAIVAAERLARSILDQAAEAIVVCDNATQIIRASEVAHALAGGNPLGQPFARVFPLQQADGTAFSLDAMLQAGERRRLEARLIRPGSVASLLVSIGRLVGHQGERLGSVITLNDITRRERAEAAVRENEQRLKSILEFLPVGVWFLNARGEIVFGNAAGQRIWAGAQYVGIAGFGQYKACWSDTKRPLAPHEWGAARAIEHGETSIEEELEIECFDGTHKIILNSAVPIRDGDGQIAGAVIVNQDITQRKAAEDQIQQLAFYDPLTRLPNRRLLQDRLRQTLAACGHGRRQGALLFIDLDNFKELNDSLGHDIGDLLLQQTAQRLLASVREADTVARLGGDEFVVILQDLSEQTDEAAAKALLVGAKIQAALTRSYEVAGHHCRSTPSIGATLISDYGTTVDDLLKRADLAMYQAKAAGRNTLRFFDPEMQAVLEARTALESELRVALRDGQFLLYYQAQVDADGRLTGAEALLRWQHPQRGLVSPAEFIPLAEQTGLILPLGQWVLATACAQLAVWARAPQTAHLTVAVNVSARQFRDPGFTEQVRGVLEQQGADPHRLELELTESLLLDDITDTIAKMTALKDLGIGFALDDFGTGYSSLAYLQRLPLDQLKIDQSFVRDVLSNPNDAAIARTIVALGNTLGLAVIAEGVETQEQRDFLFASGCRAFQGYAFGRPGPVEALSRFFE
ncbi:EAL domain-containing protein [uncultured Lamprocystis sp.]|jgi:diguanylate cyclase (GGDEF)-like protein/PAS domain S-box-containing protein|uniref:sensor domain-containing protein n=1 Tax=uncultured Lamprocystis sp. TaxID=543132 RepID=UPI0025CBD007|nr:EAL domain-containing protein [uncultured Lamprocystis sp.]